MSAPEVDVVVVGGGLAGTAVARDLARRGASVALFERRDLGAGGTIAGLGTIDTHELGLEGAADAPVRAAREREATVLTAIAPHLASRVPVLALSTEKRRGAGLLARWDALLALRVREGETPDRQALAASAAMAREPGLVLDGDRGVLATHRLRLDAQRLALAFARDAMEQGAEVCVHEDVRTVEPEGSRVRVRTSTGERLARAVVFATGADAPPGSKAPACERRVHLVVERALTTHAIVDGDVSVVPFHNVTIVTGRRAALTGAPVSTVTRDEVRALLASLARTLPDLREARVDAAYASLRRASAASSEPPVYAMPLGTPWDARVRAEEVGARIAKVLALATPGDAASAKVPGGESIEDSFVVAERLAIPEPTARRVVLRHGARSLDIGARMGKRRTESSVVCACDPVLEAEVRHAVRVELARDVCDVGRRTRLGHGACGGMRCAHRAAEIVANERALAPSEAHAMARRFLAERWSARLPALDPITLAQEELAHARWASSNLAADEEGAAE